ncbi:hypothetical protein [Streptomyces cyaneofuscatus]|uniref:hypothetical protein n=1 Tax=Streptomyces cyaneofuscatus TaxID=66883 RepID=UPI0013DA8DA4|nr:hypothetical protein [Streptomyces cyaneofuscatus]NDZ63580.1 hypothetical protein [Streptomyces cyaneofuscatus]
MKTLKALRPYTASAPLRRLATGLIRLCVRLVMACMAGEGWEKLWRALGALLVIGTTYRAAGLYPLTIYPVLLLLGVSAWRAGAPAATDGQEQQEAPAEDPLTREELAAAMHEIGSPHAHLSALATHLDTTPARVREGCAQAGIPIAGGVRMKGAGVSTGVKATDFPPLPSPEATPSGPVVVAGQSATTTATGPTVTRHAGGAHITVTPPRQTTP